MVEPVNVRGLPARAQAMHTALVCALHPESATILELQHAGISKARIETLYPFEFADASFELLRTIRNWPCSQLRYQMAELTIAVAAFFTLLEEEETGEYGLWAAALEDFERSPAHQGLLNELNDGKLIFSVLTYVQVLFDCWWVLANWERIEMPPAARFVNMHHSRLNRLLSALENSAIANGTNLR